MDSIGAETSAGIATAAAAATAAMQHAHYFMQPQGNPLLHQAAMPLPMQQHQRMPDIASEQAMQLVQPPRIMEQLVERKWQAQPRGRFTYEEPTPASAAATQTPVPASAAATQTPAQASAAATQTQERTGPQLLATEVARLVGSGGAGDASDATVLAARLADAEVQLARLRVELAVANEKAESYKALAASKDEIISAARKNADAWRKHATEVLGKVGAGAAAAGKDKKKK